MKRVKGQIHLQILVECLLVQGTNIYSPPTGAKPYAELYILYCFKSSKQPWSVTMSTSVLSMRKLLLAGARHVASVTYDRVPIQTQVSRDLKPQCLPKWSPDLYILRRNKHIPLSYLFAEKIYLLFPFGGGFGPFLCTSFTCHFLLLLLTLVSHPSWRWGVTATDQGLRWLTDAEAIGRTANPLSDDWGRCHLHPFAPLPVLHPLPHGPPPPLWSAVILAISHLIMHGVELLPKPFHAQLFPLTWQQSHWEERGILIPVVQMMKLRHQEVHNLPD